LKGLPVAELSADEAILHALNRLAYGPRPGDVERIKQMGLAKWIDQQLNPKSIDDSAVEARLNVYPTLKMPTAQLLAEHSNSKQAAKQELRPQNRNPQQGGNGAGQDPVHQVSQSADAGVSAMAQDMDPASSKEGSSAHSGTAAAEADAPSPMK